MVSAKRNFPANVTLRKDGTQWMEHAPSDGFGARWISLFMAL
jgi:hypothetical protein